MQGADISFNEYKGKKNLYTSQTKVFLYRNEYKRQQYLFLTTLIFQIESMDRLGNLSLIEKVLKFTLIFIIARRRFLLLLKSSPSSSSFHVFF